MRRSWLAVASLAAALVVTTASPAAPASTGGGEANLAIKLSNPISDLISVPFQFNYDCCFGPENGGRSLLNIQPVVPIQLSPDWNLIVRTILPVISQQEPIAGVGNHFGLGDALQSFFLSPTAGPGDIIWGVGPAIYWPTASSIYLGPRKLGAGPTFVVLKQASGWTVGLLANHIWSFAGESETSGINNTYLQPFVNYTWPDTTGITLNTESSYNWNTTEWSVPLNLTLSHIYRFGTQPVSFQIGARWYPTTFEQGAPWYPTTPGHSPRWGARFAMIFLFPA